MKWISTKEQMPDTDDEVLVFIRLPDGTTFYDIDRWQEQHECPVDFSSVSVPVGVMWDQYEFEEVTHWCKIDNPLAEKPIPTPTAMYYPPLPIADVIGADLKDGRTTPVPLFSRHSMMNFAREAVKANMEKACPPNKSENG